MMKFQKPTNTNGHLHSPLSEIFLRCRKFAFLAPYELERSRSQRLTVHAFFPFFKYKHNLIYERKLPHLHTANLLNENR